NLKVNALAAGLVYCASCGRRMQVIGRKVEDKQYLYYKCIVSHNLGERPAGCAGAVKMGRIDAELWDRLWNVIENPAEFQAAVNKRIGELQAQEMNAESECKSLETALNELTYERQKVISWARRKIITERDLEIQMSMLDDQERDLNADLARARLLVGDQAARLMKVAQMFLDQVRAGAEAINAVAVGPEQEARQFEFRRRIIQEIVKRVDVAEDKTFTIYTEWDFPGDLSNSDASLQCRAVAPAP
ncbi:MAG TPA: zinc ribbon domain-containing protein, partial [Anaerolinea sp.]|nr:zinc ribbon domain-containing protein [Anaerolinea sp.]